MAVPKRPNFLVLARNLFNFNNIELLLVPDDIVALPG
jgi:hypothetical protein